MSTTLAFDVTAAFFSQAPRGFQLCGYDTGSDGIAWTPAMWAANPGAVHIDQAPDTVVLQGLLDAEYDASDAFPAGHVTSDVLDCENGAVPVGSPLIAAWARAAQASFSAVARPGQRQAALYCSLSNVTANVNALVAGGVTAGVGLWVADWDLTQLAAIAELLAASGPFPLIGVQFSDDGDFDADAFSAAWLGNVSGEPPAPWTFGPLTDFELVNFGPHSLSVSFSAPQGFAGTPPSPAPGIPCYEMAVTEGSVLGPQVAGYPRYLPKGANPETWAAGGLEPGTRYTVAVRAYGPHAGPWSTAGFTTPEAQ